MDGIVEDDYLLLDLCFFLFFFSYEAMQFTWSHLFQHFNSGLSLDQVYA